MENQDNLHGGSQLIVRIGTHVEIELIDGAGNGECMAFDVVLDKQADFYSGLLGESTPLAKAILGKPAGITVPYRIGDIQRIRILSLSTAVNSASDAAAQRQAEAQAAREQIARTNAINFATTTEGKWGEYDPDAVFGSDL